VNEQQFIEALSVCFEAYGKKLNAGVGKFWLNALNAGGISLDQAGQALAKHALDPDTGQYLPKIADIVRHCQGTTEDAAEIAWGRLQQAIGSVGRYTSVVFDDPRLMNAIELSGGWVAMCNADVSNQVADRAAFRKAYKAASGQTCRKFLPGLHAEGTPPKLIGSPQKCNRILQSGTDGPTMQQLRKLTTNQLGT